MVSREGGWGNQRSVMYALSLFGWMFLTLAVCGLVVPAIQVGEAGNDYSVGSVIACVVLAAVGGFIVAKTRRAD